MKENGLSLGWWFTQVWWCGCWIRTTALDEEFRLNFGSVLALKNQRGKNHCPVNLRKKTVLCKINFRLCISIVLHVLMKVINLKVKLLIFFFMSSAFSFFHQEAFSQMFLVTSNSISLQLPFKKKKKKRWIEVIGCIWLFLTFKMPVLRADDDISRCVLCALCKTSSLTLSVVCLWYMNCMSDVFTTVKYILMSTSRG